MIRCSRKGIPHGVIRHEGEEQATVLEVSCLEPARWKFLFPNYVPGPGESNFIVDYACSEHGEAFLLFDDLLYVEKLNERKERLINAMAALEKGQNAVLSVDELQEYYKHYNDYLLPPRIAIDEAKGAFDQYTHEDAGEDDDGDRWPGKEK